MVKRAWVLLGTLVVAGLVVGMVGLLSPNTVDATEHSATRSFSSASVTPGSTVEVTVTRDFSGFGQFIETLEQDLNYVQGSGRLGGDSYDPTVSPDGRTITATLIDESVFRYSVTTPNTAGSYSITGVVGDSDRDRRPIGGLSEIIVGTTPPTETTDPIPPTETTGPIPPTETTDPIPPTETVGASATREFDPDPVSQGGTLVVTITASNYGGFGQVVETIPSDFVYVSSNFPGADYDSADNTITFTLLDETSFTYTLMASTVTDDHPFSGTLSDSEKIVHDVSGDSEVTVEASGGCHRQQGSGSRTLSRRAKMWWSPSRRPTMAVLRRSWRHTRRTSCM